MMKNEEVLPTCNSALTQEKSEEDAEQKGISFYKFI
jgi:hypothetical protein